MWGKIGKKVYRYRYMVFILTMLIGGFFSSFAPKLPALLDGDGFKTDGEYTVTEKILEEEFNQSRNTVIFYIEKKKNSTEDQFNQDLQSLVKEVEDIPNKDVFLHPLVNPSMREGSTAYMTVLMKGDTEEEHVDNSLALTEKVEEKKWDALTVKGFGYNIINDEVNKQTQKDLKKAELIGVPIAFLVLLLSFGTLGASILPIINGALSVAATMGILYFLVDYVPLSIYVLNVTPMVGLALSIDFALLFVNRFKEEIVHHSIKDAVVITFSTAGRAILFSALCVFVGLSGLFFFDIEFIQSVAISGMIVVMVSLFFSLTLLPASLVFVGKRIAKKGKKPFKSHRKNNWRTFGKFVMKHPIWMTLVVLVFIVISILPLRNAELGFPSIEVLPKDSPTRIAFEKYEKTFNNDYADYADVTVVLKSAQEMNATYEEVEQLIKKLEEDKNVYKVESIFSALGMTSEQVTGMAQMPTVKPEVNMVKDAYVKDNQMILRIYLKSSPKEWESKVWVKDANEKLKKINGDFTYYVGGNTKYEQELETEVIEKALPALSVILGSTFLILMVAFRSILIPLKAIIMNVLSLSATIGIIVWLFNGGHFGLEASMVLFTLPVFIFGLVFGLSMDYEVFLISRIHELYQETGQNEESTLNGLVSTSKIITSAALIMIVVTGAFTFTEILPVKQMGLGIALAIFVDATIIRLILVPSLMKLLGDWNWWFPGKKKHVVEKIS